MSGQQDDDLLLELKKPIAFLEKVVADKKFLANQASTTEGRAWLQELLTNSRKWGAVTAKFSRTCDKTVAAVEKALRRRVH